MSALAVDEGAAGSSRTKYSAGLDNPEKIISPLLALGKRQRPVVY
jgi:hypothetical protein